MFKRFQIPKWILPFINLPEKWENLTPFQINEIKEGLAQFSVENPEVSIVIPAYNEEKDIYKTLASFSKIKTNYKTELIVVNNNSTDRTQEILDTLGVKSVFEPKQGISFTRQTGFDTAKGKYHLNADADSIYPSTWVDAYVEVLKNKSVTCVYGRYSFIPSEGNSRIGLGFYEIFAEMIFNFRRKKKDYLNVMGFNFAFRREDGLKIGGFNTDRQRWQDGWMGLQLQKYGKIDLVAGDSARVWTSDRRLTYDGTLWQAFVKRVKNQFGRIYGYVFPKKQEEYKETGL